MNHNLLFLYRNAQIMQFYGFQNYEKLLDLTVNGAESLMMERVRVMREACTRLGLERSGPMGGLQPNPWEYIVNRYDTPIPALIVLVHPNPCS